MKKIGIMTFHRAKNYGAMLQSYALQETLNKNSTHTWWTIDAQKLKKNTMQKKL